MRAEQLAWAVNKDQPQLLELLNRNLATMQQNGSLDSILNKWLPVRATVEASN